jgi:uncharacterized repeat protein (TIGR03803 family)
VGGLIQASDGFLYGTCAGGGEAAEGTLFRLDFAGNLTRLHSFDGPIDGGDPAAALIEGADGDLYGTAASGGAGGHGTVFRSTTDGLFSTLHAFAGSDGTPYVALVEATDGGLYGTTWRRRRRESVPLSTTGPVLRHAPRVRGLRRAIAVGPRAGRGQEASTG